MFSSNCFKLCNRAEFADRLATLVQDLNLGLSLSIFLDRSVDSAAEELDFKQLEEMLEKMQEGIQRLGEGVSALDERAKSQHAEVMNALQDLRVNRPSGVKVCIVR
jgi:hypothetical protein